MKACAVCGSRVNRESGGSCCRCGGRVCAEHYENKHGESLCSRCGEKARDAERRAVRACFEDTCPICGRKGGLQIDVAMFRELPRSRSGSTVGTCRDVELGAEREVHCANCRNKVCEFTMLRARKAREAEASGNIVTAINLYGSLMLFEETRRLEAAYGPVPPLPDDAAELADIMPPLSYEDEPVNAADERVLVIAPAPELRAAHDERRWRWAATAVVAMVAVAIEAAAFVVMVSLPILVAISAALVCAVEISRRFFIKRGRAVEPDEAE
jgi:hypothetical protein